MRRKVILCGTAVLMVAGVAVWNVSIGSKNDYRTVVTTQVGD